MRVCRRSSILGHPRSNSGVLEVLFLAEWATVLALVGMAGVMGFLGFWHANRKDRLANCRYHSWEYVPGKGMVCSRCSRVAGEEL